MTSAALETEAVPCGVEDPWVVVGAFHASVESQSFSWELPGVQGTRVGQGAVRLALDVALVFPLGEVT